ncbi:Protein LHCP TRANSLOCATION DEFECT [Platanthera guangdongensis]|uniref:Protein LHCP TRANSLOCATION DEFECT n=1 Tax=Platanthera guangdongensis TaxID=2320717 RepID=A0ABR2MV88_9ASPA
MATTACSIHPPISSPSSSSSLTRSSNVLRSPFLAFTRSVGWRRSSQLMKRANLAGGGGGALCWFKFGNRGIDAEGAGIYGSQSRDDFDRDDVEQVISNIAFILT